MAESKKKCRQYSIDYLKFGFIPSLPDKTLPMCLLCNKVLSNDAMKPSKLEDHLKRCHPEKTRKELKYFQTLKEKFQKRPTMDSMFAATLKKDDDGLRASYNISLLIAKSGKPHTIGEQLILPAIEEVLKTVLHRPAYDILKKIPLSNNTVQRRIDEMNHDVESYLCNYLQTTYFSIQLDESTLPGNEALLLAYVRFVMDQEIHEERTAICKNFDYRHKRRIHIQCFERLFHGKSNPFNKYNISSNRWSTCHGWALSWFSKSFKTVCTWAVCNSLCNPSTTFSC